MKYRIVKDDFGGFEVQARPFLIWLQCNYRGGFFGINTNNSIEDAENFARKHASGLLTKPVKEGTVLKQLGNLPKAGAA